MISITESRFRNRYPKLHASAQRLVAAIVVCRAGNLPRLGMSMDSQGYVRDTIMPP